MNKDFTYYRTLADGIENFIKHNSSYILGASLDPQYFSNSYFFKEVRNVSFTQKLALDEVAKAFNKDLKNHLIFDNKLKFEGRPFPRSFTLELSTYIYDSHYRDPGLPPRPIIPNIEEFTKVIKCFESLTLSLDLFIHNAPKSIPGKNINLYLKEVLSLNNFSVISDLNKDSFREIINDELEILTNRFSNEKDIEIKDGISNYLKNRESLFKRHNDKDFEVDLFEQIKVILHSDYWDEMVDYLPNIRPQKKIPIESKSVFKLNDNPIQSINLDKEYILGISRTIITDRDFSTMISVINEAINLHKPENIDFITPTLINGNIRIFLSSEDMTQDKANKIGKLFESMIHEYNSENVVKTGNYSGNRDEIVKINQEYLNKAAEVLWLHIELSDSSTIENKRKYKI
jgi:hypothetical protein